MTLVLQWMNFKVSWPQGTFRLMSKFRSMVVNVYFLKFFFYNYYVLGKVHFGKYSLFVPPNFA